MIYNIEIHDQRDQRDNLLLTKQLQAISNRGLIVELGSGYSISDRIYDIEYQINSTIKIKEIVKHLIDMNDQYWDITLYDPNNDQYYFSIDNNTLNKIGGSL